ncbi:glycosyltransferase family 2 protein [Falsiroseomonas sp.]|uniref:glycosyltransferase n=1 Tax=Falsiroseomonas sp. TaxID=2870721 RepID=UPI002734FC78|nr:glycosyltransferase family 2 protein [Falsiroseomonas sp.]MDP3417461.1 glycosyltransferase family 2 protein [Falsiroseomonas sp.]
MPISSPSPPRLVIAIPARDEADQLPACLAALAVQQGVQQDAIAVLVLANNCSDDTAGLARSLAPALPYRLEVAECCLPPRRAHAGGARRAAMDAGAALFGAAPGPDPLLFSTDADGRATPGWIAANLAAFAAGADAVAGTYATDPTEAALLPASLRRWEAMEARYAALLEELATLVDSDPHDPWPRHAVHSGASIALRLSAYRAVGGLPELPVGEDRALFAALLGAGLRVRHSPAARVIVSCRLEGRAVGGMADTLRQRLAQPDAPVDDRLEPALAALLRLRCRHALRRLHSGRPRLGDPARLALALGLPRERLRAIAAMPHFWPAWEELQRAAPALRRRPLRLADLPEEIARGRTLLKLLRLGRAVFSGRAAGPAGSDLRGFAR